MCRDTYRRTCQTEIHRSFQLPERRRSFNPVLGCQRSPPVNFAHEIDRSVIGGVVPQRYVYLQYFLADIRLHECTSYPDGRHAHKVHILPDTHDMLAPEGSCLVLSPSVFSSYVEERRLAHTHKNFSTLTGDDQVGDVHIKREEDTELLSRILSVDQDAYISGDSRKVQENPIALPVDRNSHGAAQPSHLH